MRGASFPIALLLALLTALAVSGAARAQEELVGIELAGGEVVGKERGRGSATVEARVTNNAGRELTGVRIAAYFSGSDSAPPDNAKWFLHEFVFEPPLQPGDSTLLRFRDEGAAEYVALEVRRAVFGLGVSYNGREASFSTGLKKQGGVLYVATRDLMDLIGGTLGFDSKTYFVSIQREGVRLELKRGLDYALKDGARVKLDAKVLEIDDRTYLPLEETAALLGLSVETDEAASLVRLSD